MADATLQMRSEKTFALPIAFLMTLLFAALVVVSGLALGKYVFWSDVDESRIDQQLAYFKQLVESQPKVAQHRVNLGYTYYLKGDFDAAIQQYKVAIDLDKRYADAYYDLGLVYQEMKQYDEALENYKKSTELAPLDYKNFLQMGKVYIDQKKYKEALEALNRANKNKPGSSDILYQIGVVAEKTGDKEGAIFMYQEALRYDPAFKEAKDALKKLKK